MYPRAFQEQLLRGDGAVRPRGAEYTSRFERWYDLASVRYQPRRQLGPGEPGEPALYFPPELYPVVLHPLVAARGESVVRGLLLHRLHDYLDFTTELENIAVIPVATSISRGRSGLALPEQMRADAYKIVTDEAWHAQFSYDFARQLVACTGCPSPGAAEDEPPAFVARLDLLRERLPSALRGVESLLFAVVSETLISGILGGIPGDTRLPRPVREVVRDHAEDEGRHHVYFRSVLQQLWAALTPRERSAAGPLIPAMVYAFLEPDYAQTARRLGGVGLADREIDQVIAESWPAAAVRRSIAEAAGHLVRYLTRAGVLDDPPIRAAFARAGLLPGPAGPTRPTDPEREFAS